MGEHSVYAKAVFSHSSTYSIRIEALASVVHLAASVSSLIAPFADLHLSGA